MTTNLMRWPKAKLVAFILEREGTQEVQPVQVEEEVQPLEKPVRTAGNLGLAILIAVAKTGEYILKDGTKVHMPQWVSFKKLQPELIKLGHGTATAAAIRDCSRTLVEEHQLIPNKKGQVVTYLTNNKRAAKYRIAGASLDKYTAAYLGR